MKPPAFEYHRAFSAQEAVDLLVELGDEAKILAGGQSLAPMMNFRLARPSALVDVNAVSELDYVTRDGDALRIGALTRHRRIETLRGPEIEDGFAVLSRAARWIGHYPIRTRGTIGGSLAHADPSAEWCLLARLFDARVVVLGPNGTREIPAAEWFTGFLTTQCAADEMVTEVVFPRPRRQAALTEFARRQGDFAIAAAAVALEVTDGVCSDVSVVLGGVGGELYRATRIEDAVQGQPATSTTWEAAGRLAAEIVSPPDDAHGTSAYRKHLVGTLTERAFAEAAEQQPRNSA
jgi:aerobic carbon-monoxide dehydrogenase medium subunit